MNERVQRAASSRSGRKVLAKHGHTVERTADIAAKSFGLAWLYVIGLYLVVLLAAWVIALVLRNRYAVGVAVLVTVAVVPPLVREFRKRGEVKHALGRGSKD